MPPGARNQDRRRITAADRILVEQRDGAVCAICRTTEDVLELDHIVPRWRGGTDDLENLRLVCRAFNRGARCPALVHPAHKRGRGRRPTVPPQRIEPPADAILTVEIRVARKFWFHQLALPGSAEPTYHRWLWQAIEEVERNGYEQLTIVIDETEYQLQLNP